MKMKTKIRLIVFAGLFSSGLTGCQSDKSGDSIGPQQGTGGSMARFAITGNTLYIAGSKTLEIFDISTPDKPVRQGSKKLGFGIETLFPYRSNLFVGANDGMYIFDNSNPGNPSLLSKYTHVMSCDPVVVQNQYAYVTLRGGGTCRLNDTQSTLDVVDVSDPQRPARIHSQILNSPYGLGVSGNKLFVCEGENGFKVFDLTDPRQPGMIRHFHDIPGYDVIVRPTGALILIGKLGLYQYSFSDGEELTLLSTIPVSR